MIYTLQCAACTLPANFQALSMTWPQGLCPPLPACCQILCATAAATSELESAHLHLMVGKLLLLLLLLLLQWLN
jgi:hypothetical protein